jgi:aspartyl-tRNA(Asn)/glutamyl-tRNA(Gln) amidotransferase subunit A
VPDYTAGLNAGVQGVKLGVPRTWFDEGEGTEPETLAAFEAALDTLRGLGAELVEVDGEPFINARTANMLILIAEAYTYHEKDLQQRREDYGAGVRERVLEGAFISAAEYINAQRARSVITEQVRAILGDVDAIVSPSAPRPATTFEEFDPAAANRRPSYTNPYNLTGLPAISVPCGFSSGGLPLGLQIAGRAFEEATVLRIAAAYEQATDWHTRHPAL